MKFLGILVFVLICCTLYSQNDEKILFISNNQNQQHFPFDQLNKKGNYYTITLKVQTLGLGKFRDQNTNIIDIFDTTTALEFELNDSSGRIYYYPINNKKFNYNYFEKKINSLRKYPIEICLKLKLLKTSLSERYIIFNKIKLLKP
ncbi:hypothetical protein ACOCEA_03975 [Maribacter sp. CXY002]|uniref:hypothetical protein n=1 Tax=Maribacter luteocoastalis TaxID=3407671 RepID=UPI003B67472D